MNFSHTNLSIEVKLPKLVRDNIPDHIKINNKIEPKFHIARDADEFRSYALQKLVEEATEIKYSETKEHMTEEFADLKELTIEILHSFQITEDEIEKVRLEKAKKNGGFQKKYILESK